VPDPRLPPNDIEAEEAVLGSLLLDGEAIFKIVSLLSPEDFYRDQNREVYAGCFELFRRNEGINQVTLAHELSRRQVHVQRDLAPDLPKVAWDPGRMVQVLSNLLVNSAQAIGHGGRVVIRGRRDNGWLRLEVQDDGAGIPAEHRTRVFDPFFTTKPEGTGLGLSISHGIVNEHGGRIEVASRTRDEAGSDEPPGTTVRVIVPIGEKTA